MKKILFTMASLMLIWGMTTAQAQEVTFQVDMSAVGGFDSDTDEVQIRGNFTDWATSPISMSHTGGDIFSATVTFPAGDVNAPGDQVAFKFFSDAISENGGWELAVGVTNGDNRGFLLPDEDVTLLVATWNEPYPFNNPFPAPPPPDRDVTFSVNMSAVSGFDSDTDEVQIRGNFTDWGTSPITMSHAGDDVFTATVTFPLGLVGNTGDQVQFKFFSDGGDAGGWEGDVGPCGTNRCFDLPEENTTLVEAVWNQAYPGDNPFPGPDPESRDVTFSVNMSIQIAKGDFDPATENVTVAGAFNGWSTDANPLTDAGDGIFSTTINIEGDEGNSVDYKYTIDGGYESFADNRSFTLGEDDVDQILPVDQYDREYGAIITEAMGIGWRTLSNPTATSMQSFLDPIWTQGMPGADFPGGEPSVLVFDVNTNSFIAFPDNLDNIRLAGTGTAVFVYERDEHNVPESANWPKVLSTTATAFEAPVVVDEPLAINQTEEGFSLLGNPFFESIDYEEIELSGGFMDVFYVGDPSDPSGWRPESGSGLIAPFQGFVLENNPIIGARSVTFPEEAKTTGATFYNVDEDYDVFVKLQLSNEGRSTSLSVKISEDGTAERMSTDALSLQPLSSNYFVISAMKEDIPLAIANFPSHEQELQIPLNVESSFSGTFTINVAQFDAHSDWNLELIDTLTGEVTEISAGVEYVFDLEGAATTASEESRAIKPLSVTSEASRFVLNASTTSTSAPVDNELPVKLALNQNYPNPFNPTTQISYDLPESADVRLEVFNIQGQRVATLVNAAQNAGTHTVTFDAANLASGVYLYRLQAGATVLTKKMTLVK